MFRALQHSAAPAYLGPPSSPPDARRSPRFRASNSGRKSSAEISAGQPCAAATTASTAPWASACRCGRAPYGFVRVRFLSACKARNAGGDLRTLGSRFSGVRDEAWDYEFIPMAQAGDFGGLAKRAWSATADLGKTFASASGPSKNRFRGEPWQRRRESVRPERRDVRPFLDLHAQALRRAGYRCAQGPAVPRFGRATAPQKGIRDGGGVYQPSPIDQRERSFGSQRAALRRCAGRLCQHRVGRLRIEYPFPSAPRRSEVRAFSRKWRQCLI